jgi:hypothetical protein
MLEDREATATPPVSGEMDLDLSETSAPRLNASKRHAPSILPAEEPDEELSIDLVDEAESRDSGENQIADRIHQLEFSLQQGLREEAEQILRDLEARRPLIPR